MIAPRLLLFGASGAIGSTVARHAAEGGWHVTGVSRGDPPAGAGDHAWLRYDPDTDADGVALAGQTPFDAVCWAQGTNIADSPQRFDADRHLAVYRANVLSVLVSMAALVERGLLAATGARLVVVSSIWQECARQNKLSYTVSKAAVGGLVRAASIDLGADGHLINAVLPGVLDTPMAAANLSPEQIDRVRGKTLAGRLPDLDTVAATILFLCSRANASISGQSIPVDLGMTHANLL